MYIVCLAYSKVTDLLPFLWDTLYYLKNNSYPVFFQSTHLKLLYKYVLKKEDPLKTYATGILAAAVEHEEVNSQHGEENTELVCLKCCLIILLECVV